MIDDIEIEKKFNKIISSRVVDEVESISIIEIDTNIYQVFGKYYINKRAKNQAVVASKSGDIIHEFTSMRNAICWCIYDIRGKYVAANRIIMLDRNISSEEAQITVHRTLLNKSKNTDDKLIYLAKLNEDKFKRQSMISELTNYLDESDYWQQSKFKLKTTHYNQK